VPEPENPESPPALSTSNDLSDLGVPIGAKVCGNCRLFKPVLEGPQGWTGDCRVMLDRGLFPATAPICNSYLAKTAPLPRALKPAERPSERKQWVAPLIRTAAERLDAPVPELEDMTREELKSIIREALVESDVRLAPKWEGGTVLLKPADTALQPKELPIDALFHKVVMVRDRLRVLEQKVNAHAKLSDADKVEFQQYITRCYGSLTSFNLLFADRDDQFIGDKGKAD
jgi:hypothetical protein